MDPLHLTEAERREIRAQKRAVWAQKGAGRHYHHLAHQKDPVTRLKNLTELAFVLRAVSGPRILDAGAGTGRFTFPLQDGGFAATALDISQDMLQQGKEHATRSNTPFCCVRAEIERMPFPDSAFDDIISMTVLRHFPEWQPLLDEFARVVRDGGRIVFDMASGEQQLLGDTLGIARPHARNGFHPLDYDSCVLFDEMRAYAESRGLHVVASQPHDLFNNNPLVEHILGESREDVMAALRQHLAHDTVLHFCEMIHRRFLPVLGLSSCSSVLYVLQKGPAPPSQSADAMPSLPPELTGLTSEEALLAVLKHALGRRYASFMREAARHMTSPEVRRFVAFCREQLLPRLPVETLLGRT